MAGDGEGVDARHDADGKEPGEVRNDDEHEEREDQRHEPAAFGADIGAERVVDEAVDAFDRRLPAARHQRGLARSPTHDATQIGRAWREERVCGYMDITGG